MSARKIIVTGATAGIGFGIAQGLLEAGYDIFICGRDPARLDRALGALEAGRPSGRVGGAVCDVRDLNSVQALVGHALRHHGSIDGLVNNAGTAIIREFGEITPAMWIEIVETNLTGAYNCSYAALPALKEAASRNGVADIVNIGSRSGRYAFAGGTGYNTTKFGLQGMTEAMFLDLNRYGIRVGLVAPGTVNTGLGGTSPAGWHLQPQDVANAVTSMIGADPRGCINWIEIRPARPPLGG